MGILHLTRALQEVVNKATVYDGISRGPRESIRAITQGTAQLCILVASCDDPLYCKVVESLCQKQNVNTVLVKDALSLGRMFPSHERTHVSKIQRCSCAVITDF